MRTAWSSGAEEGLISSRTTPYFLCGETTMLSALSALPRHEVYIFPAPGTQSLQYHPGEVQMPGASNHHPQGSPQPARCPTPTQNSVPYSPISRDIGSHGTCSPVRGTLCIEKRLFPLLSLGLMAVETGGSGCMGSCAEQALEARSFPGGVQALTLSGL